MTNDDSEPPKAVVQAAQGQKESLPWVYAE